MVAGGIKLVNKADNGNVNELFELNSGSIVVVEIHERFLCVGMKYLL